MPLAGFLAGNLMGMPGILMGIKIIILDNI
jgi:hypothetical protein